MQYVKVVNDEVVQFPITSDEIRATYSNISFPVFSDIPEAWLKTKNIYPVFVLEKPTDKTVVWELSTTPILNEGIWELGWVSRPYTEEEQFEKRDALIVQLAALANIAETGGISYGGMTIKSDSETQHKITAASIKAKESIEKGTPFTPIRWRGLSLWYSLDAPTIIMLSDLLYDYVEGVFTTRYEVEERINSGLITTPESLETEWNEELTNMLMELVNKYPQP